MAMPQVDSIMWLLPILFMIHAFEEIIMLCPWLTKYDAQLHAHFSALADH